MKTATLGAFRDVLAAVATVKGGRRRYLRERASRDLLRASLAQFCDTFASIRWSVAICAGVALSFGPLRASAAPWLFVSDIHLDPASRQAAPMSMGDDANDALLRSALAEMKRVDPDAPVVFVTGDFFAHRFDYGDATATMDRIAHAFGAAFPRAQFVIALGNEDSACGDYRLAPNAAFLGTTAAAWASLVNRNGAAPDFERTFSVNGSYGTRLPNGVTAFVVDDVFWAPRYRAGCGQGEARSDETLDDLTRAFPPNGVGRRWVVAHIPPGIDAFSTVWIARGFAVVPFLWSGPHERFLQLLGDGRRGISLLVAAHTHRFAYRVVGAEGPHPVPALLVPAISPIFDNDPSFLTVDVGPDGVIEDAREHSYRARSWHEVGGLRSLGLSAFTAPELLALQARLPHDPRLRATFAALYDGGATDPEITPNNWRPYWCAATALTPSSYRDCLGEGGIGLLTAEGLAAVAGATALSIVLAACVTVLLRRRRRTAQPSRGATGG